MEMFAVPWAIVVCGWMIIFLILAITHLKLHHLSGGIYAFEDKDLHRQRIVLRLTTLMYLIAGCFLAWNMYFASFDAVSGIMEKYFIGIGIIVFAAAILLIIKARIALGSNWTWSGYLLKDKHSLIQEGPYKYIRHPLYTGYLLAGVASGLVLTSSAVLFVCLFIIPILYWEAIIEEQHLQVIFPDEYKKYMQKTRMFF
ncbi:isoprenylcysteine carboxylmethyltransferase family protein [Patescibacteria group bacterium]|nr:isoprenylcysteine carboxylmethyltransferase family protein [Patescibacteria group bacterium]